MPVQAGFARQDFFVSSPRSEKQVLPAANSNQITSSMCSLVTGPLSKMLNKFSFRWISSRKVFVSPAVCEGTVSWIPRGKQTSGRGLQVHHCFQSTIGAAFLTQTVCLDDTTVKFEIWDTAGQERYHSLAPMYYRGAQAAIVVYDITNADTFERAKSWVKELQRQVEILSRSDCWLIIMIQASPNIVIALAGNKADLTTNRIGNTDSNNLNSRDILSLP